MDLGAIEIKLIDILEPIILTRVAPDDLLIESGLVDSLAAVDVALAVEQAFGCQIPAPEIDIHMESVRRLATFVAAHKSA